jgi:hypothetical protein
VLRRVVVGVVHADTNVASASSDGAETITRFAPASTCAPRPRAREAAGRLDHDVDAELGPGQLRGAPFGDHPDRVAVDQQLVAAYLDLAGESAVGRVVPEEVRIGISRDEVVDGDELDVVIGRVQRAYEIPTDPTKPIYRYAYRHTTTSSSSA